MGLSICQFAMAAVSPAPPSSVARLRLLYEQNGAQQHQQSPTPVFEAGWAAAAAGSTPATALQHRKRARLGTAPEEAVLPAPSPSEVGGAPAVAADSVGRQLWPTKSAGAALAGDLNAVAVADDAAREARLQKIQAK